MQPIAPSITPQPSPAGVDPTDPSAEPDDGFAALLAGLVAPPVASPPAAAPAGPSDNRQLALTAGDGSQANETGDGALASPPAGDADPATVPALAVPPTAGAGATAAGALGAGMPNGTNAPIGSSAQTGDRASMPASEAAGGPTGTPAAASDDTIAAVSNLAAGTGQPKATEHAAIAPLAARPEARRAGPQAATGRTNPASAAARPEQPAARHSSSHTVAVGAAAETATQAPSVTAEAMARSLAMAMPPGQTEWQPTFGDQTDGSLLRGLAAPIVGGGDASLASLTETQAGHPAQPMRQVAAVIDRAVTGEVRQLTIQLSPQELGTIDIALSFDEERRLSVSILAERPETLEILKNDVRQLERLLGRQGIDLADSGLELGLMKQERHSGGNAHESAGQHVVAGLYENSDESEPRLHGASDTVHDPAVAALGAERRLNLSI